MTRLSICLGLAAALGCILATELLFDTPGPAGTALPENSPAGLKAGAEIDTGHLNSIAGTLLQRPLFSPDRRLAPAGSARPGLAVAGEALPRLSGVVIGPAGARAIFDDGVGRQKAAAQGDSVGRFKVGIISPGQVSLTASDGEHVLRPKLALPPGAAAAFPDPSTGPAR